MLYNVIKIYNVKAAVKAALTVFLSSSFFFFLSKTYMKN